MVIQVYKIWSEIWVAPSPKILRPRNIIWRDFAQLRDLIANISGSQQDIVNQKMSLQTTGIPI